ASARIRGALDAPARRPPRPARAALRPARAAGPGARVPADGTRWGGAPERVAARGGRGRGQPYGMQRL
ncbi:MAG: hypothetical protein AVDCRST_MAG11-3822, partial [uncultured Gemmatimonadaceae bacterium]